MRTSLRTCAVLCLPLLLVACRRDFTEAVVPATAASLALATHQAADTTFVDLTLGGGAPVALASITGDIAHRGGYAFVQCVAQQPQALLACKAHGETVRVAAAWAGGTHAGALVRLAFVRSASVGAPSAAAAFMLTVSEAHGARGEVLLNDIEVRRESVVAEVTR